jgi:hypothetical protein
LIFLVHTRIVKGTFGLYSLNYLFTCIILEMNL